jgi:thioesterase domain-containing protein
MAAQLEAEGQETGLLVVFDTWDILTMNRLWLVDYYLRHLRYLRRQSRGKQIKAITKKVRGLLRKIVASLGSRTNKSDVPDNPWKTGYKPNVDFVPKRFSGDLTVYRIQNQPYYRTGDETLGWGKRVEGRVDVEYIPGAHPTILRDPNVQILAQNLRERIQAVKDSGSE